MKIPLPLWVCVLAFMVVTNTVKAEGIYSSGIDYEYSSGDYGLDSDTDITKLSLVTQYIRDKWRFRLSIPYIRVSGDENVIPSGNGINKKTSGMGSGGATSTGSVRTDSGLGDVFGSISYAIQPMPGQYMYYEVMADIKWGTASATDNLGTGENDYSLSLNSTYLKHKIRPYLTLGYMVSGDTDIVDFSNTAKVDVGMMYILSTYTSLGLAYNYQQAALDVEDEKRTLSLFFNRQSDPEWYMNIFLQSGLTNSVAGGRAGISLIRNF